MSDKLDRRDFFTCSVAASAAVVVGLSAEEKILLAQAERPKAKGRKTKEPIKPKQEMATAKLGSLDVSRVFCGGNLLGGWAHSRDLKYVSSLLKAYHTKAKVFETLHLAEENGINMINTAPNAGNLIDEYWREGGKIQWMVQATWDGDDWKDQMKRILDYGCDTIQLQGNVADRWVRDGKIGEVAKAVDFIKDQGIPAGVGCHMLDVVEACEKEKIAPDYYFKTLHSQDYFSAKRPGQPDHVLDNGNDNYWCTNPEETVKYMNGIKRPWVAFKVMAAGAIHPFKAFEYAFKGGADFICAGMFDFQIAYDASVARKVLAQVKERPRPWCA